mmetsp:Transcript_121942/g.295975  ORF Transcript_121942/g.295975 Transcript_121942/m.295975 type:complete len:236 (-) Transcript_121942:166-873(-)
MAEHLHRNPQLRHVLRHHLGASSDAGRGHRLCRSAAFRTSPRRSIRPGRWSCRRAPHSGHCAVLSAVVPRLVLGRLPLLALLEGHHHLRVPHRQDQESAAGPVVAEVAEVAKVSEGAEGALRRPAVRRPPGHQHPLRQQRSDNVLARDLRLGAAQDGQRLHVRELLPGRSRGGRPPADAGGHEGRRGRRGRGGGGAGRRAAVTDGGGAPRPEPRGRPRCRPRRPPPYRRERPRRP